MKFIIFFVLFCLSLFGRETLHVQLNWKPQFEFAAFYMAKEFGFYDEAGLDVHLHHIDPKHPQNILQTVKSNKAQIGVYYSSIIPIAAQNGEFEILSYIFQTSPFIAVSKHAATNLKKSCLYLSRNEYNGPVELLMKKLGVTCRKNFDEDAFLKDPEGIITYSIFKHYFDNQGFTKLSPKELGVDMYDDIIFAEKEFYTTHKTAVRSFVLATLKGWRYALNHFDKAIEIIHKKYAPNKSIETLEQEAKDILSHSILSVEKTGIFNPHKLHAILTLYAESSILNGEHDIYDFVDPLFIDTIPLTFSQRELIAQTPILYSETTWPPFTIVNEKKEMEGMIEEYLKLIYKRSGLDLRYVYMQKWSDVLAGIKQGTLDMAMATGETPSRRHYAVFSKPYDIYDIGIASKREHLYTDVSDLKGKRVAVGEEYTAHEMLLNHSEIKILPVASTKEALALLHAGKVDAVVDIMPTLAYYIGNLFYSDIYISGKLPQKFALRAMFKKELAPIRDIFDLALASITPKEKKDIEKRYSPRVVHVIDVRKERYFKQVITLLILLLLVALLLGWQFKKELKKRLSIEKLLRKQATQDPLTRLYNRRFFNTFMEAELAGAKREGGKILFAIFDIDNFKRYNDRYGHLAGDNVLRSLAKKIRTLCKRKSDFLFRLGGEEFGIFAHVEDEDAAREYMKEIVRSVEEMGIEHAENEPFGVVTISLGAVIAEISPASRVTLEEIYKRADELMYTAKILGKNRAVTEKVKY